jgi:hypothetical protein
VETAEQGTRPATLIQLHKLGFKLVPLSSEHQVVISWTPIYEDSNFWFTEKIVSESAKFKNVVTVFGKSQVTDEQSLQLYLNCFEIDSENVNRCFTFTIIILNTNILFIFQIIIWIFSNNRISRDAFKGIIFIM